MTSWISTNKFSELVDALSDDDGDLDDFDFTLEDLGGERERPFADSSKSFDVEGLLASSLGSAGMDFQFEALDGGEDDPEDWARPPSVKVDRRSRRGKRDRSPSPRPREHQRFPMKTIDFDPPAQQQCLAESSSQAIQASYGDMTLCSAQGPSPPPAVDANQQISATAAVQGCSEIEYNEALRKLADSMRRSEMTRRHVMMQRDMLAPEQQRALFLAKERLNQQAQAKERLNQQAREAQQPQSSATTMAFLLNGAVRGYSLANGLEQGRKTIGMYMGQVNHKTL